MSDNVLIKEEEPAATTQPASTAYPLDWETAEIKLAKGRFRHTLRRPTAEQIYKREEDLQTEIPIGKDGSYALPDPTVAESKDAEIYDELIIEAQGYTGDVPRAHKAAAFQGLYQRELEIEEDADLFAEEVAVIDEIGSGIEPDFTIRHIFRQPTQSELDSYKRKTTAASSIKPGKRGRQILATRSTLKSQVTFYEQWLVRIEGASIGGKVWSDDLRPDFLNVVDPLIKRKAVQELVGKLSDGLSD